MISFGRFPLINRNSCAALLVSVALAACGGGGGGAGGGQNFGSTPNNTKPQSSTATTSAAQSSDIAGEIPQTSSSSSATSLSTSKSSSSKSSSSSKRSSAGAVIDTTAPTAPGKISTSALYNRIALNWGPATDNVAVVYYRIYRDQALVDTLWAPEDSFVDFDVAPNRTYTYSISAGDAVNNWSPLTSTEVQTPSAPIQSASSTSSRTSSSANSNSSNSSTRNSSISPSSLSSSRSSSLSSSRSSAAADTAAPSLPTSLHQDAALASHVDLSWNTATDDTGVTGYKIYRDGTPIGTVAGDILSFSDTAVQASHQYLYGVSAGDAAGNWSAQQTLFVTTPAASNAGDVTLIWLTPIQRANGSSLSMGELSGFELRYKRQTDTDYTYVELSKLTLLYIIPNLSGDYQFEIAAIDTNNLYSDFKSLSPQ